MIRKKKFWHSDCHTSDQVLTHILEHNVDDRTFRVASKTNKQTKHRGLSGVAKSWLFNSEGGKFSVHKLARLVMFDFSKWSLR